MSKLLGGLVLVLVGVACGGTTDLGDESGGGTSPGGASHAGGGSGGSGSAGQAGSDRGGAGGTGATGGSIGSAGAGGSIIVTGGDGGVGGGETVDPRCPARRPGGACAADDTGLKCQYENSTGCLCYSNPANPYTLCNRVDPSCPNSAGTAGTGAGGFSTKVALPPKQSCSCSAGTWTCNYGF